MKNKELKCFCYDELYNSQCEKHNSQAELDKQVEEESRPSVDGVERIIIDTLVAIETDDQALLPDLTEESQKKIKSKAYFISQALLPYLKDKVEWDVTELAISLFQYRRSDKRLEWHMLTDTAQEHYITEAKALTQTFQPSVDKRVEWDNDEAKKVLEKEFVNMLDLNYAGAEFTTELHSRLRDCVYALSKMFQPPQRIWPKEFKQPEGHEKFCQCDACTICVTANNMLAACKAAHPVKEIWKELPKKFNGADLCAVREDFGWWVGYDCNDLEQEISATGKTLDEAFNKLNDYWFKSGKCKEAERKRRE